MKVGRNDPCPCGSGKKYKKCHLPQEQAARTAAAKEAAAEPPEPEPEEDAEAAAEGEAAAKEEGGAAPKKKPRAERGGVRPAAGAPKPTMHRRKV